MEDIGEFGVGERHGLIEVLGSSFWLLCGEQPIRGKSAVGRPANLVRGDGPWPRLAVVEMVSEGHVYTHTHLYSQGHLPPRQTVVQILTCDLSAVGLQDRLPISSYLTFSIIVHNTILSHLGSATTS